MASCPTCWTLISPSHSCCCASWGGNDDAPTRCGPLGNNGTASIHHIIPADRVHCRKHVFLASDTPRRRAHASQQAAARETSSKTRLASATTEHAGSAALSANCIRSPVHRCAATLWRYPTSSVMQFRGQQSIIMLWLRNDNPMCMQSCNPPPIFTLFKAPSPDISVLRLLVPLAII